jgi:hypothetical protein
MGWEELEQNPFVDALDKPPVAPYSTGQRYAKILRGAATLGVTDRDVQPESIGEHAAAFVGSIPTIAATTALLTPAVGAATGLAAGTGLRLGTAAAFGAIPGTVESIAQGDITQLPKEIGLNVLGEAAFIGGGKVLRKLRPAAKAIETPAAAAAAPAAATPAQTKLAALTKATSTVVPDTPPTPIKFGEQGLLPLESNLDMFPPSAGFGPKIDADAKSLTGTRRPHGRVTLDEYTQLADEYGNPIQVAPETKYGVPGATQLDEFGQPVASLEQVGPEGLAQVTTPAKPDPYAKVMGPSPAKSPDMTEGQYIDDLFRRGERKQAQQLIDEQTAKEVGGSGVMFNNTGMTYEEILARRQNKMFQSQPSRELGTQVVVPLTKEADDVVKVLMNGPSPRQVEMQFTSDQLEFFASDAGKAVRARLDSTVPKRDAVTTSEVVKLPEEAVQKIVDTETPVKVIDNVILGKTKDGKLVDALGAKNSHSADDLAQMQREATENIKILGLKGEGKRIAFKLEMLRLMRERCLP